MPGIFSLHPQKGQVPVFNSSCPWATSKEDLQALCDSPYTSAVVTRTTTLNGFPDDPSIHQVAFFDDSRSSINSYGYSPHRLDVYLNWIEQLLEPSTPIPSTSTSGITPISKPNSVKPFIISITGSVEEVAKMLTSISRFAKRLKTVLGVEFNASCPNIPGSPPPAFSPIALLPYIQLLASRSSTYLKTGLKLPPFTSSHQIESIVRSLGVVVQDPKNPKKDHPINWLSCCNTLGGGLVYVDQASINQGVGAGEGRGGDSLFAVPSGTGGLAGKSLHQLSLGNVYRFAQLLYNEPLPAPTSSNTPSKEEATIDWIPAYKSILVIGIGGADSAEAVERFRKAGASAVACATALGREGVAIFEKMAKDATRPIVKL